MVPPKFRQHCSQELHIGHLGVVKTKGLARSLLWWPVLDKDIAQMIKHCATCQANADNPRVGKMCLIVINALSKWPERVVLQSTSAGITVEKLRTIVANKGISEILVSDNGPQFVAGV